MQSHLIHMEEGLVLRKKGIARLSKNPHQHFLSQVMERHNDREATYELWDHSEINDIPRFSLSRNKRV